MQSVGAKRPGRPLRQHVYRNARKYATLTLAPTPSVVARLLLLLSHHARHALRFHSNAMSIILQSICSTLQDKCLNFEVHSIRA